MVDVFATLEGHVALLKIDIEGAEWAILEDPRLAALDAEAIVLEWHAMGCPIGTRPSGRGDCSRPPAQGPRPRRRGGPGCCGRGGPRRRRG